QDSSCLLHALSRSRTPLELVAAHVDHALRPDSAEVAARVKQAAAAMGFGCEVRRVDVAAYRRGLPAWSVQQAARAARYQVLARVAQEHQAAAVLVAHTADDQAETVLLNLLRGSGLGGLAGMPLDEDLDPRRFGPPLAELGVLGRTEDAETEDGPRKPHVRLARPLLRVRRATTLAYCAEAGLTVIEDASNQSRDFTRNRVRLDLLPALERYNPGIPQVLARTADLAAEDLAALEALIDGVYTSVARTNATEVEFELRLFQAQPRALQRRLLRRGLQTLLGDLVDVRAAPIEDALDLIRSARPANAYHLPHGVELCIGSETILLRLYGKARRPNRRNTRESEVPQL
ncbi:MAG TPA: tRNA lysidine(34) synthetase TilS, partial [Chloroflexota bacterium]|nr:tRNA lysidine(34) synthetase TilS [Chloroflexota bacterium]